MVFILLTKRNSVLEDFATGIFALVLSVLRAVMFMHLGERGFVLDECGNG